MNRELETIVLSLDELSVLQQLAATEKSINKFLNIGITQVGSKVKVQVDESQREDIRTALTESLAKIGFDADYSPTKEGRILEDMIDKLFKK